MRDGNHVGLIALAGSNVTLGERPVRPEPERLATRGRVHSDGGQQHHRRQRRLRRHPRLADRNPRQQPGHQQRQHRGQRARPDQLDYDQQRRLQPPSRNGNYFGLADPTGTSGNLSADPRYFNTASLPVRAAPRLAGGGRRHGYAGAPATDFFGNPRFQDPNITGRGDGSGVDIGAIGSSRSRRPASTWPPPRERTRLRGSKARRSPSTGPSRTSAAAATGSWHDAVYLSPARAHTRRHPARPGRTPGPGAGGEATAARASSRCRG